MEAGDRVEEVGGRPAEAGAQVEVVGDHLAEAGDRMAVGVTLGEHGVVHPAAVGDHLAEAGDHLAVVGEVTASTIAPVSTAAVGEVGAAPAVVGDRAVVLSFPNL